MTKLKHVYNSSQLRFTIVRIMYVYTYKCIQDIYIYIFACVWCVRACVNSTSSCRNVGIMSGGVRGANLSNDCLQEVCSMVCY